MKEAGKESDTAAAHGLTGVPSPLACCSRMLRESRLVERWEMHKCCGPLQLS